MAVKLECRNGCGKFLSSNTRNRHEIAYCPVVQNKHKNNNSEIEKLKGEIEKLKDENEKSKKEILRLSKIEEDYINLLKEISSRQTQLLEHSITNNTKSISAINYLSKCVTKVPVLKHKKKEIEGCLENLRIDDIPLAETIIIKYKNNELISWISQIIIEVYRNNSVELQAFWSTDSSRMKYILGKIIDGTKNAEWITDDGGVKVTELVIQPILLMIIDILEKYFNLMTQNNKNIVNTNDDIRDIEKTMVIIEQGALLKLDIENDKLVSSILKVISLELNFKRYKPELDMYYNKKTKNDPVIELIDDLNSDLSDNEEIIPKKVIPKKVIPKKEIPKKEIPKKVIPKKVVPKKVISKKEIYSDSSDDSSSDEEVIPKKVVSKKVVSKKVVSKKEIYSDSSDESSDDLSSDEEVIPKKVVQKKVISKKQIYSDSSDDSSNDSSDDSSSDEEVIPKKVVSKKVISKKEIYSDSSDDSSDDEEEIPKKVIKK